MPAVLFSYVFSNDSGGQAIGRGRAYIDSFGRFTKDLVDVDQSTWKIVFVAGGYASSEQGTGSGYAPSMQRIRKRGILEAFKCVTSTLYRLPGYAQRVLGVSRPDTRNLLTVTLTWDDWASDLDLHILEPGGRHIYYANKGENTTRYLTTTGFRSERYIISNEFQAVNDTPINDTYRIRVHYFRNRWPISVRRIRWTVQVEGKTQENTRQITGVLRYDNRNVAENFASNDRSWSGPFEATVEGTCNYLVMTQVDRVLLCTQLCTSLPLLTGLSDHPFTTTLPNCGKTFLCYLIERKRGYQCL